METGGRKLRRRLLRITLLVIAISCAGLAFYLHRFLKGLNPRIEQALSDAFGSPIKIGDSDIGFWRGLSIRVHDVEMTALGDCASPFKIEEVSLKADLGGLLQRRFRIHNLLIQGLILQLERGADGRLEFVSKKSAECPPRPAQLPDAPPAQSAEETALDLDLQIKAIEVAGLDAEIRLPGMTIVLDDFQGTSGLSLGEDRVELTDLKLSCKFQGTDLTVAAAKIEAARAERNARYEGFMLKLGASTLGGSGNLRRAASEGAPLEGVSDLSKIELDFNELSHVAASLGVKEGTFSAGKAQGSLKLSLGEINQIEGALNFTEISRGNAFRLTQASLSPLHFEISAGRIRRASAKTVLKGLLVRDGKDEYKAAGADGEVSYAGGPEWKITSNKLAVSGFEFQDSETFLSDIDAELTSVAVESGKDGVNADVKLNGRKLKLKHIDNTITPPEIDFEIKDIGGVDSPLRITVPRGGGYDVSGPVKIKDAALLWQKREFQRASGSVTIKISQPLKRFEVRPLSLVLDAEPAKLTGLFEMTPAKYALSGAELTAFGGATNAQFSLGREAARKFASMVAMHNVDAGRLLAAVIPGEKGAFEGTLNEGRIALEARWPDLKQTVSGSGRVKVSQGDLKQFDFTQVLGKAVHSLPGVKPAASSANEAPETPAQTAIVEFDLKPGLADVKLLELFREAYSVRGSGSISFEGLVDITARVTFLRENLGAIGGGLQSISGLFGDVGRLDIPIAVEGKIPKLSVSVNKTQFLKEKSGITTVESVIGKTGDILGQIGDGVTSPFRGGEKTPNQ